jgi:hypothetical protein
MDHENMDSINQEKLAKWNTGKNQKNEIMWQNWLIHHQIIWLTERQYWLSCQLLRYWPPHGAEEKVVVILWSDSWCDLSEFEWHMESLIHTYKQIKMEIPWLSNKP